eukprot:gene27193-9664_t
MTNFWTLLALPAFAVFVCWTLLALPAFAVFVCWTLLALPAFAVFVCWARRRRARAIRTAGQEEEGEVPSVGLPSTRKSNAQPQQSLNFAPQSNPVIHTAMPPRDDTFHPASGGARAALDRRARQSGLSGASPVESLPLMEGMDEQKIRTVLSEEQLRSVMACVLMMQRWWRGGQGGSSDHGTESLHSWIPPPARSAIETPPVWSPIRRAPFLTPKARRDGNAAAAEEEEESDRRS